MLSKLKNIHRGWLMVAAGLVACAAAVGLVQNCYSLYLVPVCEELGFTRSQMSMNQTILGMGTMLVSLLWGPVFSKLKLKRLMGIAAAVTCAAYFLCGFARNIFQFYALSAVLAISAGLLSWSPLTVIIGNWFNEKRGLAIGITFMGSGVGGMLFNALGGVLISSVGWRWTFMIYAIIMACTMLPVVVFGIKVKPEDVGLRPYGAYAEGTLQNAGERRGLSFAAALKVKTTWLLCGCFLLLGFCFNSMNTTTAPNMRALGYSAVYSANVVSAYMATLAVAKIVMGGLCDRFGTWKGCGVSLIAITVATVCAAFARNIGIIAVYVVCNGFGSAFGSVAFPIIARDLYGERDQASIAGIFSSICSLGGSFGPTVCGLVYDMTGAYSPAYLVMTAVCAVFGTVLIVNVARNSGKWKNA